jgi:hypothetical protein
MSLHPQEIPPVPEETMRVVRAALPRGNSDRRMRDELGSINDDQLFACIFPMHGVHGSRALTCRPSGGMVSANQVTWGWPGYICSICSRPWPSMWSAWARGGGACL